MISIIISSYQQHYLDAFKQNVEENIGVPYEIIVVENKNAMSLCRAYNIGAQKARFNILCFSHEDLVIQTPGWGEKVVRIFSEQAGLGLLGIAGGSYKPLMPSHWSFPGARLDTFYMNVFQEYRHENKPAHHFQYNPQQEPLSFVATIDGVWFCTRKEIVETIPFDEETFTSFHAYDVDTSLAIGQHYKVAVTYEINIHHFSEGKFSHDWIEETLKLHQKWRLHLPVNLAQLGLKEQHQEEQNAFLYFARLMMDNKYDFTKILKLFRFQNAQFKFSFAEKIGIVKDLIIHKIKTRNFK